MTQLTKLFSTSAFRLSLATVTVFAMTAALLIWFIFPRTTDLMTRQVMDTISAEARALREQFDAGGLARLRASVAERLRPSSNSLYYLTGRQGQKLGGNLNRVPPEIMPPAKAGTFTYSRRKAPGDGRADTVGGVEKRLAAGVVIAVPQAGFLVVARDIDDQRQFAQTVKWAMYGGFSLLLAIGLGGGLLVSRHVLGRIEDVTRTSERIMAGDLSGRIALDGSGDELDRLSANLNAMLERIEQLMAGLREVSDNIAHDLRTPLNRLRNRAEAALREGGEAIEYRKALEGTIDEADGLIKTFNALLSIARLEAGALADDMRPVDLQRVLRDVGELYEPAAEEAGFSLTVSTPDGIWIRANRQLIGQMIANLIDNAIKYSLEGVPAKSPASGTKAAKCDNDKCDIEVSLRLDGRVAQIIVADHGPGISPGDRARALQRFVRLDASRSRPGSGLGLALVTAVVRLHGGSISLEDNNPGLRVVILFPDPCDSIPCRDPTGKLAAAPTADSAVLQDSALVDQDH